MQLNKNIINQFKLLINYLQYLYDHSEVDKIKNKYRLLSIKKGLKIIKEHPLEIKSSKDLNEYYGIGEGIKSRVDEIIKTGKLKELNDVNKYLTFEEKNEIDDEIKIIKQLTDIIGIGRSNALKLIHKYNVKSLEDLKKKSKEIELNSNIKLGLKYYGVYKKNIPRNEITEINNYLNKIIKKINNKLILTICGSYRRGKLTSNDIDVLLTLKDKKDDNYLSNFIEVLKKDKFIVDSLTGEEVITKYMGFCKWGNNPIRRIDVRYVPYKYYYSALVYFTGPDDLNKKMRQIAKQKGYKLSEYGLMELKSGKILYISSEKDIFDKLGMKYLEPNER